MVEEKILITQQSFIMNDDTPKPYSRKDFLRTAGSTALFATLGISFMSCGSVTDSNTPQVDSSDPDSPITISGNTITIDLNSSSVSSLRNSGGWLLIREAETLVVNIDGSSYRAFTSVCTHSGCSTNWNFNGDLFTCTCHNSKFNTSGEVVQGPASRDLEEFSVEQNNDELIIKK